MLTRRKFIGTTLGAGVALATAGCATQPSGKRMIVDAQVHMWKANTPDWPWVAGANPQLPEPFTIERIMPLMNEAGIDRVVIVPPTLNDRNDYALEAVQRYPGRFDHLLVAPFNLRQRLVALLDQEIENAQAGKRAYVIFKLNNLEDPQMIQKLQEAVHAGVEVRLMARSICCLPPVGIEAISIVGRFLEHTRTYIFHNGGDELYYVGSADLMTRNLTRRVEVLFPIFNEAIRAEIRAIIDMQREGINDVLPFSSHTKRSATSGQHSKRRN